MPSGRRLALLLLLLSLLRRVNAWVLLPPADGIPLLAAPSNAEFWDHEIPSTRQINLDHQDLPNTSSGPRSDERGDGANDSAFIGRAEEEVSQTTSKLTTALLRISYDGRHFTGWSAANDPKAGRGPSTLIASVPPSHRKRGRRKGPKGFVRSVQGVLRANLAKIYGDIDADRVVVEGCSRTDKGVHASGMVAQFYCLSADAYYKAVQTNSSYVSGQPSIPGKRLPHPRNATDSSCFESIPKDLSQIAFALNRMCLDVQIVAFAPVPEQSPIPFHPTQAARRKTYRYTFSVGRWHDPTQWRWIWHIGNTTNLALMKEACECFQGRHDFCAFQGTPRSLSDRRKRVKQNTFCTIDSVTVRVTSTWHETTTTYVLEVVGDRFLYKMVRFLVGAVVAVGQEKLGVKDVQCFLETGIRKGNEFYCAPAHGLVLQQVDYDMPIEWYQATC